MNKPCTGIPASLSKTERIILFTLLSLFIVLRVIYAFHLRVDSDEPQHLHVVWAWANGQLQYRDVFDNHSPLFQMLCAPLFKVLGVRGDILLFMRLAMLPLFLWCLWIVYRAGCKLYDQRTAAWAALIGGAWPVFFFTSTEFRTDDLWAPLCLASLAFVLTRTPSWKTASGFGVIVGAAFATSMKTSLFIASLAVAALIVLSFVWWKQRSVPWRQVLQFIAFAFLCALVVPGIFVVYFWAKGALPDLYYCVIEHNVAGGRLHQHLLTRQNHIVAIMLPVLAWGSWQCSKFAASGQRMRVAVAAMTGGCFLLFLEEYWPMITAEDYLPGVPVVALALAPAILRMLDKFSFIACKSWIRIGLPFLFVTVQIVWLLKTEPLLEDRTTLRVGIVKNILKLTNPDDFVMDGKGETIYRRRADPHHVFEGVTFQLVRAGIISTNIPAELIAKRAPVVSKQRLPRDAKDFIAQNYLPISWRLLTLGKIIALHSPAKGESIEFDLVIPERYTLVTDAGRVEGILDGEPFTGARMLAAGHHTYTPSARHGRLELIWAQAIERGFSPYTPLPPDITTQQD